jgi:hypothetical protein
LKSPEEGRSSFLAFLFQVFMQAQMDFLGKGFAAGILIKVDGLLQRVNENEAGLASFHVAFQLFAQSGIQLPVHIFRKFF